MKDEGLKRQFPLVWDKLKRLMEADLWKGMDTTMVFQELLGISDEDMTRLREIGEDYLISHRFDEAADVFLLLVILNPYQSGLWMRLGNAEHQRVHFEDALPAYEMAALYNPFDPFPYIYMGQCFKAMGKIQEAIDCFDQGIEIVDETQGYPALRPILEEGKQRLLEELQ